MNQLQFFNLSVEEESLPVAYTQNFLSQAEADQLFAYSKTLPWQQNRIKMLGKWVTLPRQEVMYGDVGCQYTYSNSVKLIALPWIQQLLALKKKVEQATMYRYKVAIANYYQTGAHYIGWHSDGRCFDGRISCHCIRKSGRCTKVSNQKERQGNSYSRLLARTWFLALHAARMPVQLHSSATKK